MFRRIGIVAAVGVTLGAIAGFAAPAGAAPAPAVTATGQIYCQVDGKITFTPKLVFNGTQPTIARFSGTTGYCYSGPEFTAPPVAGITSARITGSFPMPTNDCGTGGGSVSGGPNDFTVKWKPPSRHVVKTSVTIPDAAMVFVNAGIDNPVLSSGGDSTTTGSFAGNDGSLHLSMFSLKHDAATMCRTKTPGVPGTGGLKKLEFGGGDSFFALERP
jgi:hypothetical protein